VPGEIVELLPDWNPAIYQEKLRMDVSWLALARSGAAKLVRGARVVVRILSRKRTLRVLLK
jgi:hypothetical protein